MNSTTRRIQAIFEQLDIEVDVLPSQIRGGQRNQVWGCGPFIVRLNDERERQPLHEETTLINSLPHSVSVPDVVAVGRDKYGEWQVQRRLAGRTLVQDWEHMPSSQRREAVHQLANLVRALHQFESPTSIIAQLPRTYHQIELPDRITELATELSSLPFVEASLMNQVVSTTREVASAFTDPGKWGIVHHDLHFDNVLWDGESISGLLDYERACLGPVDLELDILLRFCAFPALFVHEEHEHLVHAEAFGLVPTWFSEFYPEIFSGTDLTEHLSLYSLNYDLNLLKRFPPRTAVDPGEGDHLINRIRATVEGESYLHRFLSRIRN